MPHQSFVTSFKYDTFLFSVPKKNASNLRARFENMAQQTTEDAKLRAEEERKRREAREKKEREEAQKREEARLKLEDEAERKRAAEEQNRLVLHL